MAGTKGRVPESSVGVNMQENVITLDEDGVGVRAVSDATLRGVGVYGVERRASVIRRGFLCVDLCVACGVSEAPCQRHEPLC